MKKNRVLALIMSAAVMTSAIGLCASPAAAVWVKSDKGYSFRDDETGEKLSGWQTINGKKYYFGKDNIALTGWKYVDGRRYYFIASQKGRMATGLTKIGGKIYYFGNNGVRRTGEVIINGKMYFFDRDGSLKTDCYVQKGGKLYKIDKNGVVTNQAQIEDKLYTLDEPLENIEWGMDEKEIAEAIGEDTYLISGTQMAITPKYEGAEQLTYFISSKYGCQCYCISRDKTVSYSSSARGRLNSDLWHKYYSVKTEDGGIIVYEKDGCIAIYMHDEEKVMTYIVSEKMSEKYLNGDITFAELFKKLVT